MPGPVLLLASLRYAWRHPWQLALALAGVALGVAVVTAVDLSIASSRIAFERAHAAVAGRATHVLRADPAGVDEVLYADLKRQGLPARLAPVVEGYVTVPGTTAPRTLRVLGVDLFAEAPFRPHLGEAEASGWLGEFLSRPDGALMSTESARSLGLAVGDRFTVRAGGRPHSLELLGLLDDSGGLAEAALSDLVVMDIAAAQELFDRIGRLSRVDVVAEGRGSATRSPRRCRPGSSCGRQDGGKRWRRRWRARSSSICACSGCSRSSSAPSSSTTRWPFRCFAGAR